MTKEDKKYLILLGITVAAGYLLFKYTEPRNFNATGSKYSSPTCNYTPNFCNTKCSDTALPGLCTCLSGTPTNPTIRDCKTGNIITHSTI